MQQLSARLHYLGTEYGRENDEWIVEQFKSWGFDTKIETYDILFPYPKIRLLELTEYTSYKAKFLITTEEGKYTQQIDELLLSSNAFSADGDEEVELVFLNCLISYDYEGFEKLRLSFLGQ
jgi:N-acetylated-alpha-linked acidic dipeptidase